MSAVARRVLRTRFPIIGVARLTPFAQALTREITTIPDRPRFETTKKQAPLGTPLKQVYFWRARWPVRRLSNGHWNTSGERSCSKVLIQTLKVGFSSTFKVRSPSKPPLAMVGTIDHGVTAHYVHNSTPTPIKTCLSEGVRPTLGSIPSSDVHMLFSARAARRKPPCPPPCVSS